MVGGTLALDFANTVSSPPPTAYDPIETYGDLLEWAEDVGLIDPGSRSALAVLAENNPTEAAQVVLTALDHRDAIRSVFSALADGQPPPAERVATVMAAYGDAVAASATTLTSAGATVDWTGMHLSRLLYPIDYDAGRLLLSGDKRLVKECAACPWLFLDKSRNHSRRWCDMQVCGSRSKMRRYRRSQNRARRPAGTVPADG
jgi:predicted RNA-binding Zn ribbon-like protein